jgi:nitroreductase
VKRAFFRLRTLAKQLLLTATSLFRLFVTGRIWWLVNVAESRLKYRLDALYIGVNMNRQGQADYYNLRRNTHRLEKGLCTSPPKEYFAEGYILETVDYLDNAKRHYPNDHNLLKWSTAVLDEYFRVTKHTPAIAEAYEKYISLDPTHPHQDWFPYAEAKRPGLSVSYEDLLQLGLRRRSVRAYLDQPVKFESVKKAMAVAALAPSACNRQPFQFLFYNDKDIVQNIVQIPGGAANFTPPSVVVVIGQYRAYFNERDFAVPVIDSSLSVMSFLFACETLGLATVCINWPNLPDRDQRIRKLIDLDEDEFVVMLIGIGYADPAGKIPFSAKHEVEALISCNARIKDGPNPRVQK